MVFGECGANFDPKHLSKRYRGQLISDSRSIRVRKVSISKSHIEMFFKGTKGLESMLNPKDYQNVSAAVNLLQLLSTKPTMVPKDKFDEDILLEFELLGKIFSNLLSFFVSPKMSLDKQLVDLATLAHYLFFIFRRNKTNFQHQHHNLTY